ncbi:hypothetical protein [Sphingobium aromaticiconvertens]|uniref:hypothetical protein n=1 Tax=Sphingobium aromaticiconvertens TaxID=365341 RepID=UPI0030182B22
MTENDEDPSLSRPQRRLLKRIYNGRTTPIVADGRPFLTYKDAAKYPLALLVAERDAAYTEMKAFAKDESQ